MKPLALANGRCITATPERTLASVGECPLNTQPLIFGRFTSETAVRRFKKRNCIWIQKRFKKILWKALDEIVF
jgi:hypothetical protein